MRLLLSRDSNKKLFDFLIKTNHCNSLKELACKMKIHFRTVQKWRYSENYIPEKIIPSEIKNNLKITDRQEDNWGRVKGGKITHKIILQKYGKIEIKSTSSKPLTKVQKVVYVIPRLMYDWGQYSSALSSRSQDGARHVDL